MIDIKALKEDPDSFRWGLEKRGEDPRVLDIVLNLDEERRELLQTIEPLRTQLRIVSNKAATDRNYIPEGKILSKEIASLEKRLRSCEQELKEGALTIPNIPNASVPEGDSEEENQVIRTWGKPTSFEFQPRSHWEIGKDLGILDFPRGAKLARSRFPLYFGLGTMLEWSLVHFMLDLQVNEHGYVPVLPPFLVNRATVTASGNLPKFEDQLFRTDDDLFLVPTAEVDLVNIFMNEILLEEQLPMCLTAYTPCFRREAGAGGKDLQGLIRVHQFNKVELVRMTTPETSYDELEKMVANATRVLELLELPHRVVLLCAGDMGFAAAKTYDIEVWVPSQDRYREISSCSNCEDFQSRRGNIRFKSGSNETKPRFVHGLNGSGVAIGRTVVAILENFQQADGSVVIPEALRGYVKADKISKENAVSITTSL